LDIGDIVKLIDGWRPSMGRWEGVKRFQSQLVLVVLIAAIVLAGAIYHHQKRPLDQTNQILHGHPKEVEDRPDRPPESDRPPLLTRNPSDDVDSTATVVTRPERGPANNITQERIKAAADKAKGTGAADEK
jgi:hypothetical protein